MDIALKSYMLEHFDFDGLKQAGFFKGIRKTDYQAQADKICKHFGYSSIFEWSAQPKISYHLSIVANVFKCPICTCEQQLNSDKPFYVVKCIGCKRKLQISATCEGYKVWDKSDPKEETKTY